MGQAGGRRSGAGRPKGSKNKSTLAREAVAEILDVDDQHLLAAEVHRRGHRLLGEMERIALDPTQPAAVRIVAARTALPFLLPRSVARPVQTNFGHELVKRLEEGRQRVALLRR